MSSNALYYNPNGPQAANVIEKLEADLKAAKSQLRVARGALTKERKSRATQPPGKV